MFRKEFRRILTETGQCSRRSMKNRCPQFRCKFDRFTPPVFQQRCRNNCQCRAFCTEFTLSAQNFQVSQNLYGLTQPHIIGKTSAQTEGAHTVQPADSILLIKTQRNVRRERRHDIIRNSLFQQFFQVFGRMNITQFLIRRRQHGRIAAGQTETGNHPQALQKRYACRLSKTFRAPPLGQKFGYLFGIGFHPFPADTDQTAAGFQNRRQFFFADNLITQCRLHGKTQNIHRDRFPFPGRRRIKRNIQLETGGPFAIRFVQSDGYPCGTEYFNIAHKQKCFLRTPYAWTEDGFIFQHGSKKRAFLRSCANRSKQIGQRFFLCRILFQCSH